MPALAAVAARQRAARPAAVLVRELFRRASRGHRQSIAHIKAAEGPSHFAPRNCSAVTSKSRLASHRAL
jgi:hypothetical protein